MTSPAATGEIPPLGVYANVDMALYHGWRAASNSRLSKLLQSPAHLEAYLKEPPGDTVATLVGRVIHCAIFEPDSVDARFTIAEQCEAKTKDGAGPRCTNNGILHHQRWGWLCGVHKKSFKVEDEQGDGRTIVTPEQWSLCLGVRDSVNGNPVVRQLIHAEDSEHELSIVWNDAGTGVRCKARLDAHTPSFARGIICDVKSCVDASKRAFERSIFARGYHRQGGMYLDGAVTAGLPAEHFIHIAVEKEPPYAVATYRLLDELAEAGRAQVSKLLIKYDRCLQSGVFPGYPQRIEDIGIPDWGWKVIDEELDGLNAEAA